MFVIGDAAQVDVAVVLESGGEVAATLALYDAVVPAESTVVYRPTKVELKLRKASALQWPQLQRRRRPSARLLLAPRALARWLHPCRRRRTTGTSQRRT